MLLGARATGQIDSRAASGLTLWIEGNPGDYPTFQEGSGAPPPLTLSFYSARKKPCDSPTPGQTPPFISSSLQYNLLYIIYNNYNYIRVVRKRDICSVLWGWDYHKAFGELNHVNDLPNPLQSPSFPFYHRLYVNSLVKEPLD